MMFSNNDYQQAFDLLISEGALKLDEKFNHSSSVSVEYVLKPKSKFSALKLLFAPIGEFLKTYLIKGYLAKGIFGFVYATQTSYYRFLLQAKLYEKHHATTCELSQLSTADPSRTASGLSVYMVVLNEEATIAQALKTVAWASELIVVDSGSNDRTIELAKKAGAKVYFNEWKGFPHQKQFALEKCSHDWVLSLDADEYITGELQQDILRFMKQNEFTSLRCQRNDLFMGSPMSNLSKLAHNNRLFSKSLGKYDLVELAHENPKVEGKELKTKSYFYHSGYNEITKLVGKLSKYSKLKAKERYLVGKNASRVKVVVKFPLMLLKNFIGNRYFLMGMRGYIFSIIYAYYALQKEYYLYEYYRNEE